MKKKIVLVAGGLAALGITLIAFPTHSAAIQDSDEGSAALQRRLERVQAKLQGQGLGISQIAKERALLASARALAQYEDALQKVESLPEQDGDRFTVLLDEGPSWLGVETHEVTPDSAKELKLSTERGVVVGRVTPDSPAAKAGLKEKDVITEVNGQRVEGAAQFRRMIHEIPAGRTAQLGIWRDGRAQTLSVTLAKAEEGHHAWMNAAPGAFAFQMPEVDIPEMPQIEMGGDIMTFPGAHARLGIDAEDIGGQLGTYFGAPDGEGILVRSVNAGSPAEKAGMKAGDVITSFNGERIRTVGDLREKLSGKSDEKQVKLGVLRNKNEVTLTVELPARAASGRHKTASRRTYI